MKNFYFSNYPEDHPTDLRKDSEKNKKVPGYMKDEAGGKQFGRYVGLRAKLYALELENGEETKKAKGVKKSAVNGLTFDDYNRCRLSRKNHIIQ